MVSTSKSRSTTDTSASSFKRWRGPIAWLLLVIFMVSAGLAVPAVWARNQLLDTGAFVRTVSPLGEDEAFQNVIANQVSTVISREIVTSNVVTGTSGVASPLMAAAATTAVDTVVRSFVGSNRFPAVWEETARLGHSGFRAMLTGGESNLYNSENGQVSVDLTPVVNAVLGDLNILGISINAPSSGLTFVIFESDQLSTLQNITSHLDTLAVLLPAIALLAVIGYVLISSNRRGALVVAGLGLAISMLTVLIFIMIIRWLYLQELSDSVNRDAARGLFDILLHYLRWALRLIGLAGLLVSGVVYLAIRQTLSLPSNDVADRTMYARWPVLGEVEHVIATNRLAASGIWSALVITVLLLQNWVDTGWVIVLMVIGVAGLILLRRARPVPAPLRQPVRPAAVASPALHQQVSQNLQQLAALKAQGLLTNEEFARAKATILAD